MIKNEVMFCSDENDTSENMAIPMKSADDMDTSESPLEGGYVNLDAKGTGKPIVIREQQRDADQTQADQQESPSVSSDLQIQSLELLADDHGLKHKKWAKNITATCFPLDRIQLRDVPSDAGYPSSLYSLTPPPDGQWDYLMKDSNKTYKLSKSPGKKKVGTKQRRASGLSLVPSSRPYGEVKRYNSFNEVKKHLPEYVDVGGQTYKLDFVPQGPTSLITSGSNIPSKEMNLLEAGSIDRPPEMRAVSNIVCPEMMADEPLNLTYTCKPLDLSASCPLNLSKNSQDVCPANNRPFQVPTFSDDQGYQEPAVPCISAGSQPCVMAPGDQPISLVTANYVPESPVVEGNIPNLGSLTLGNDPPPAGKDLSGKKNLQEMFKTGEISKEQQQLLLMLYLAKQASPDQNRPSLSAPSLPGTSRVMEEAPSPSVEPDKSNPLPNLCSLQLANNNGEIYISQHEKTKRDLKAKVLNR